MKASEGLEVEKKYDVGKDAQVPHLTDIEVVARVGEPHTATLTAVYFDTAAKELASRRITLRRRTGGADAGWHLKLPPAAAAGSEPAARRELHAPLGQEGVVPDALLAYVQVYLRGAAVAPVVRLETVRTTYPLYAADGQHLADLADDHVSSERLGTALAAEATNHSDASLQWREWELELVHGESGLFAAAEEVLEAAGATPSAHASKLGRALGSGPKSARRRAPGTASLLAGKKAPAAAVVTLYVAEHVDHILALDPAVRLAEPDAVHDLRSATRRLRSVLTAYRSLYSAVRVRRLLAELKWLGGELGAPRDAKVMAAILRGPLAALPDDAGSQAVRRRVHRHTEAVFTAGYRELLAALVSGRYFRLLDELESFRTDPPLRAVAVVSGRKATGKAMEKSAARLRRSHRAAATSRKGPERDEALHQVRKDAKRLRHVAESAVPVHGKRAAKVGKAAQRQQAHLGEFNDAVLASGLLASLRLANDQPQVVAAFDALVEEQAALMVAALAKYRRARKKSRHLLGRGII